MATEVKKAVDLGLLEEDDEFEEFPAESKSSKNNLSPLGTLFRVSSCLINDTIWIMNLLLTTEWEAKDEDPTDVNVWEDNWDDDTVEDDFSIQLR